MAGIPERCRLLPCTFHDEDELHRRDEHGADLYCDHLLVRKQGVRQVLSYGLDRMQSGQRPAQGDGLRISSMDQRRTHHTTYRGHGDRDRVLLPERALHECRRAVRRRGHTKGASGHTAGHARPHGGAHRCQPQLPGRPYASGHMGRTGCGGARDVADDETPRMARKAS